MIGGGPAGTWAAISAAAKGAKVILADKGFCSTSGATAPSGTGVWHVAPDAHDRSRAKASRFALGGELAGHAWIDRVFVQTWINCEQLAQCGYPFPIDETGIARQEDCQTSFMCEHYCPEDAFSSCLRLRKASTSPSMPR